MSDLKKEIEKVIGETASHKEIVWQNLQQSKRKKRMPLFVSAAIIALASIWFLLLQSPPVEKQSGSIDIGVTQQSKDGIAYTLLQYEQSKPEYLDNDYAISHATNEDEYKTLTEQFNLSYIANIDFNRYDILFALYTADGCGLIIDKLTKSEQTLNIHLELPPDLRNEEELSCTTIAAPHLAVIEIDKQTIQRAEFTTSKKTIKTAFNTLDINELRYHFDLLLQPDSIHTIEITDVINETPITVERDMIKNELAKFVQKLTPLASFVDVTDPHYEISAQANDGKTGQFYLWMTAESDTITVMSSKETHQLYSIQKSEAQFLLSYLN